jgi:hypothetical protein
VKCHNVKTKNGRVGAVLRHGRSGCSTGAARDVEAVWSGSVTTVADTGGLLGRSAFVQGRGRSGCSRAGVELALGRCGHRAVPWASGARGGRARPWSRQRPLRAVESEGEKRESGEGRVEEERERAAPRAAAAAGWEARRARACVRLGFGDGKWALVGRLV